MNTKDYTLAKSSARRAQRAHYLDERGFATGAGAGAVVRRLASGLCVVQSSGGKATRQKRGEGSRNSMPTSNLSACSGPTSTTLPRISSPDLALRIVSNWPRVTFSARRINAPCALTTEVRVSSENRCRSRRLPLTTIFTESMTRWLRRCCMYLCKRIGVVLNGTSLSLFLPACAEVSLTTFGSNLGANVRRRGDKMRGIQEFRRQNRPCRSDAHPRLAHFSEMPRALATQAISGNNEPHERFCRIASSGAGEPPRH